MFSFFPATFPTYGSLSHVDSNSAVAVVLPGFTVARGSPEEQAKLLCT